MKSWREKRFKLIQRVQKNRLVQWLYDKDISKQYRILFVILASVIIILNIVNIYFNSFKIDDTSARYLLSALVQSLAAIIAIVVTLTLVAVQLTASAYSPRVIDVFKDDTVMWRLLVVYGLSIFSGLFVLEIIGGTYSNSWCIIVPLETLVLFVYLMGISAFAGLFWHIGNVIDLLKPENIIKRLADKITKDRILNLKEDPIQPIMDIIHGSVMKYDIATTRVGLKTVTGQVIKIIDSDSQKEISKCFCNHLERVGRLAVIKTDEEATEEIIKNLYTFCETVAEKKLEDAAKQAVESLGLVGRISAENGLEDAAWQTLPRLGLIGEAAAKQGFDDVVEQAALHLGRIGGVAALNRFERVAKKAAKSLGSIGKVAVKEELLKRSVAIRAIESLGLIGEIAAKQELKDATLEAATHLGLIGKAAAEKGLKFGFAAEQAIEYLRLVGELAVERRLKTTIFQVAFRFISIGRVATEKEFNFAGIAAEYLAELSISNKEIVENVIEFNGFAFEERNRKFLNLYEKRLEKLRTQKPD